MNTKYETVLFLACWSLLVSFPISGQVFNNKIFQIASVEHPGLFLTADGEADWEKLSPASVDLKKWENITQQKWKIHGMGHNKYYFSSMENDYNVMSVSVTKDDTSMKFLRLKNVDGNKGIFNIVDMNGSCMQYKRPTLINKLFSRKQFGVIWTDCSNKKSQQWRINSLD